VLEDSQAIAGMPADAIQDVGDLLDMFDAYRAGISGGDGRIGQFAYDESAISLCTREEPPCPIN
jgi:hypothetical protein